MKQVKIELDAKDDIRINFIKVKINEAVDEYNKKDSNKNYILGYIHGLKTAMKIANMEEN